jgi:dihydroxy-acid dehydratase
LLVSEQELDRRKKGWTMRESPPRGYARLYYETVTQAPLGCDFEFLRFK